MENSRRRRKARKTGREQSGKGENDSSIDRLSNLPEPLIHHILSFLDTKFAVQTSVLSRRWKSVWKQLPILSLRMKRTEDHWSFKSWVMKVLSLRYHFSLSKVVFSELAHEFHFVPEDWLLFGMVSRYALSHQTQHLRMHLIMICFHRCTRQLICLDSTLIAV